MATNTGTGKWIAKRVHRKTWTAIANGDQGDAYTSPSLADKTVQVIGTFGAGGTCIIEGSSDDGVTWATLNDSRGEGNALSFTSADIRTILENPQAVRPRCTAGDGTTAITVIIVSKEQP